MRRAVLLAVLVLLLVGIGAILVSCGLFGNAELRLLVRAVRAGFGRLRRIPARIDLKVGTAPPVPILKSL